MADVLSVDDDGDAVDASYEDVLALDDDDVSEDDVGVNDVVEVVLASVFEHNFDVELSLVVLLADV